MGTVADKLNLLLNTKAAIRQAIIDKGQDVADADPFSSYPEKILNISARASPTTPLDPVEVYNATRPADWLPMPTPVDNEMYLLFHIPDGVSSLLAFTVTCTGSYTVALGTVSGGAFVQSSSVSVASGAKYEAELLADDYGNLTADGMKQVMIKVSGVNILTWEPSTHSKKTSPTDFTNWNIVEIACRLSSGTKVQCGSSTPHKPLRNLRYFSWCGTNNVTNTSYMFGECSSLISVLGLDTKNVTNAGAMFNNCTSLVAIPQIDTTKITNMNLMFQYCRSIQAIPLLITANATTNSMFNACQAITNIPQLDLSNTNDTIYMFQDCYSLASIQKLTVGKSTNAFNMFNNCRSLAKLTFDPSVVGWAGCDISLANCSLGHLALVDLLNSLPTITGAHTLTLTGNPGVSELTDAEKAVATGKNWTLAL